MKIAFITGITGQDGSYLAEFLLEKNYKVYGIVRRTSLLYSHTRLDHIRDQMHLEYGDMSDGSALIQIITKIVKENPNMERFEIYNLAAQSHVKISFEIPEYTSTIDGIGTLKILEAIRTLDDNVREKTRFYQAGTSEMFGKVLETPQSEVTPFNPQSPYACAKVYAHYIVKNYRESYGLYACNGILFNHESPRRGENFVTMKIVNTVKDIVSGKKEFIRLGNLDSKRDWGHSKDFVRGMWMMLQQEKADDYVLATGETYSVREFVERCFGRYGMEIDWVGVGMNEIGRNMTTRKILVKIDEKYFRPCEVEYLLGDATKAKNELGWKREYNTLESLIDDMFEGE
jgi:GDPmannose 4,6-dehydratase